MVNRRTFLKAAGAAAAGPAAGIARAARSAGKPNIIFILADDVGREVPGCFGGTTYETPSIDRLAREGTRFDHVYAAPVCHPSRVTIMTGRYPFRVGNPRWGSFPKKVERQTFAHELKKGGYATAVAGKWQLTKLCNEPDQPHRLGFDGYSLFGWHEGPRYWQPHIWENETLRKDVKDRYGPEVYTEFLIDFMKAHAGGPFLLYFPMALCHDISDDFKPPPPYGPGMDRYENFPEMVARMDRLVGRLVDAVDELGIADKTLILYTTDNGTASKTYIKHENGRFVREANYSQFKGMKVRGGKGTFTDWGIRVPTIARWPGTVRAGEVKDDLIDFSDFLPTFNDLAGLPAPAYEIDGRSFAGLLTGTRHEPREWVFSQKGGSHCVRTRGWKLMHNGRLYDLAADPYEKKPITPGKDTPASKKARARLAGILEELMG